MKYSEIAREELCRHQTLFELDQNNEIGDRGGDHAGQCGPSKKKF